MKLTEILKGESLYSPAPRMITLLEPGNADSMPAVTVEVSYLSEKQRDALIRSHPNFVAGDELDDLLGKPDGWHFVADGVMKTRKWAGLTHDNLRRMGEFFLTNPEVLAQLPNPLPCPEDSEELAGFLKVCSFFVLSTIVRESFGLEKWAIIEAERAKNG